MDEFFGSHRVAEIVALPFGTAIPPKKFELLRCLNTFCHDAHVQTSAHTDHGTDDTRIAWIRREFAHEGLIYLQGIYWKTFQMAQAGKAGPKVIERKLHARFFEGLEDRRGGLRILHQECFGQLE